MDEIIFTWEIQDRSENVHRYYEDGVEKIVLKSSSIKFDESGNNILEEHTISYNSFSEYWSVFIKKSKWFICENVYFHFDIVKIIRKDIDKFLLQDISQEEFDYLLEWRDFTEIY